METIIPTPKFKLGQDFWVIVAQENEEPEVEEIQPCRTCGCMCKSSPPSVTWVVEKRCVETISIEISVLETTIKYKAKNWWFHETSRHLEDVAYETEKDASSV